VAWHLAVIARAAKQPRDTAHFEYARCPDLLRRARNDEVNQSAFAQHPNLRDAWHFPT